MLIGIDGYEASAPNRVGVGRFEVELLKSVYNLDTKNSYRIYTPFIPTSDLPPRRDNWQYKICSFNRLWSQIALPFYLIKDNPKPDVFFAPIHYAPRFISIPTVVGIMDLSFLHFPQMFLKKDLYKLSHWTSYSIKRAKKVIAISNSTKNDIISSYNIEPKKIEVCYPGIDYSIMTNTNTVSTSKINQKFGILGDYILYVGTLQPRKNLALLIDAFKKVKAKNLQLVLVGKKGWMYDDLFKKVKDEGLEKQVLFTDYVNQNDLEALYKGATCFCLVSLYEGFGFPVLEAMKHEVPVITSNVSSLPEAAGDAAVLVDPNNIDDIAKAIETVLSWDEKTRQEHIQKGKEQVKKFTWEKCAREVLTVLESVGKK